MPKLVAFVAGIVFAVGLALSGMTNPAKVIGFLDFFGAWDYSLAFVMAGAVAVYLLAFRTLRGERPVFARVFVLPDRRDIDRRLVLGAALFGIGWGLSGLCPGPAIVSAGSLSLGALLFVAAMIAGMMAYRVSTYLRADTST